MRAKDLKEVLERLADSDPDGVGSLRTQLGAEEWQRVSSHAAGFIGSWVVDKIAEAKTTPISDYETAVLDACVVSWVSPEGKTPRELLHALMDNAQKLALDPLVSEEAKVLQQAAYDAGIAMHSAHCASVHTEPLLQAVIDAGLTEQDTKGPTGSGGVDHAHTMALMGRRLKEAPRWTAVTEKLPLNTELPGFAGDPVLATNGRETCIASVRLTDDGKPWWAIEPGWDFKGVTHWMPLPSPPKGAADE